MVKLLLTADSLKILRFLQNSSGPRARTKEIIDVKTIVDLLLLKKRLVQPTDRLTSKWEMSNGWCKAETSHGSNFKKLLGMEKNCETKF